MERAKEGACHIRPADIERVMEVAGRLFAKNGYDGVGIRQIADESGVKMPSIFYHFGSKASLFDEVLEYKYTATIEMLSKEMAALTDPKERLDFVIGSFFDLLLRDRTFSLLIHRDIVEVVAHKRRPAFMEVYSYVFSMFCTLLEAAFDRSIERKVAFALVSLILGFCELTAVMNKVDATSQEEDEWFGSQRSELIEVGKRILPDMGR